MRHLLNYKQLQKGDIFTWNGEAPDLPCVKLPKGFVDVMSGKKLPDFKDERLMVRVMGHVYDGWKEVA